MERAAEHGQQAGERLQPGCRRRPPKTLKPIQKKAMPVPAIHRQVVRLLLHCAGKASTASPMRRENAMEVFHDGEDSGAHEDFVK